MKLIRLIIKTLGIKERKSPAIIPGWYLAYETECDGVNDANYVKDERGWPMVFETKSMAYGWFRIHKGSLEYTYDETIDEFYKIKGHTLIRVYALYRE